MCAARPSDAVHMGKQHAVGCRHVVSVGQHGQTRAQPFDECMSLRTALVFASEMYARPQFAKSYSGDRDIIVAFDSGRSGPSLLSDEHSRIEDQSASHTGSSARAAARAAATSDA